MPRKNHSGVGHSGNGKPEKKLNYKQKSSIRFVNDEDPPFIRAMKQTLGYREPTVDDKFTEEVDDDARDPDDITNMSESERPTVVVIDPKKDISVDQLDEEVRKKNEEEDRRKIEEGKITFKKPTKRSCDGDSKAQSDEKRKKSKQSNSKMLSFADEDE